MLAEEITSHFKEMLKTASDKITKISKLDKDSWEMIDKVEEKCTDWTKELDRVRDEQVCI